MQQGKGIIKFFLVVMTLVTLLQYLFILPTRKVEKDADEYAQSVAAKAGPDQDARTAEKAARVSFLDSMSSEEVFSIPLLKSFTYDELKSRQLALGLDLKGGMSVILQVDLRELIRALADDSKDPTFIKALETATQKQTNAQADYVSLFADSWREVAGQQKLAPIFARNKSFTSEINYETSDADVIRLIRTQADETVKLTFQRLKERIDQFGVTQPNVSLDASRDLIIVELPGIDNPERARKLLIATAELQFWNVYRVTDAGIAQAFRSADAKVKSLEGIKDEAATPEQIPQINEKLDSEGNGTGVFDTTYIDAPVDPFASQGPLLSLLQVNPGNGLYPFAVMGLAKKNDRTQIDKYLELPQVKALFPNDLEFHWSSKPETYSTSEDDTDADPMYQLYAIKKQKGSDKPPLGGDLVQKATANPDPQTGEMEVALSMNTEGARIWGNMTTKAAQDNNREIAIVLDEKVVSAPRVNQAITGGNSSITGGFTTQEAQDLASVLEIGKLPAKTKIIQESIVGPSLGQKNINRSLTSLFIGFIMVFLFMIVYYGRGGIVSILALFLNIFFIFGALASYGTVLTLPGIAGIILTIGMAVDANVIIYERIREELREGKSMLMSISDGFKHSYSAIIDANVTTILTAFVLAYFGMGPIKGFAVVLIIGVLSSIFTAVLVGRLMIDWWTGRGNEMSFWTGMSQNAFSNMSIDFLGKRKVAYTISGIIIALGFISFFVRGFDLGVDFKGGYSYNIQFDENQKVDLETLKTSLNTAFGSTPVVKAVDTDNTFNVVTSYMVNNTDDNAASLVMAKLHEGISAATGNNTTLKTFSDPDGIGTHVTSSSKVGPTIADDIKSSSFYAAIFALLLIFLYIFIRFNKWQYSMGAVAALFHDTLIVLSLFSIFHGILPFSLEIDQAFIAAVLTVIGYSINDTVVVFDRIREYLNNYTKKSKEEVINMAVNSTISRTVITSLTTLFVILILFVFGGASIKGFAFALLIGVIVGTYSSVFIATPIMSDFTGDLKPKEAKKTKSSFSRAAAKG